jgi:hypothetical protein
MLCGKELSVFSVATLYKSSTEERRICQTPTTDQWFMASWPLGNPFHPFGIGEPHCATQNNNNVYFLFYNRKIERNKTEHEAVMWTLSMQGERRDGISLYILSWKECMRTWSIHVCTAMAIWVQIGPSSELKGRWWEHACRIRVCPAVAMSTNCGSV